MADKNRVLEKLKKEGGGGVIKLFTRLSFNGTDTYIIYSMFARSRSV